MASVGNGSNVQPSRRFAIVGGSVGAGPCAAAGPAAASQATGTTRATGRTNTDRRRISGIVA